MRIWNGRIFGDRFGKLSYFKPSYSNVVEYVVVVSDIFYDQILFFCVDNFDPTLTVCHCLLQWKFSASLLPRMIWCLMFAKLLNMLNLALFGLRVLAAHRRNEG